MFGQDSTCQDRSTGIMSMEDLHSAEEELAYILEILLFLLFIVFIKIRMFGLLFPEADQIVDLQRMAQK